MRITYNISIIVTMIIKHKYTEICNSTTQRRLAGLKMPSELGIYESLLINTKFSRKITCHSGNRYYNMYYSGTCHSGKYATMILTSTLYDSGK